MQYRNESIKGGERQKRGESKVLEVQIHSNVEEAWCSRAMEELHQHKMLVLACGCKEGTKVVSLSITQGHSLLTVSRGDQF